MRNKRRKIGKGGKRKIDDRYRKVMRNIEKEMKEMEGRKIVRKNKKEEIEVGIGIEDERKSIRSIEKMEGRIKRSKIDKRILGKLLNKKKEIGKRRKLKDVFKWIEGCKNKKEMIEIKKKDRDLRKKRVKEMRRVEREEKKEKSNEILEMRNKKIMRIKEGILLIERRKKEEEFN